MQKHHLVSYTLSDKTTYDLVQCFVDKSIKLDKDTDIYDHLKTMHPDHDVYIENLVELYPITD